MHLKQCLAQFKHHISVLKVNKLQSLSDSKASNSGISGLLFLFFIPLLQQQNWTDKTWTPEQGRHLAAETPVDFLLCPLWSDTCFSPVSLMLFSTPDSFLNTLSHTGLLLSLWPPPNLFPSEGLCTYLKWLLPVFVWLTSFSFMSPHHVSSTEKPSFVISRVLSRVLMQKKNLNRHAQPRWLRRIYWDHLGLSWWSSG